MAMMTYDSLIGQIEALSERPPSELLHNDNLRRRLRDAAKSLNAAVEMPGDTVYRIGTSALQGIMARIGIEAGIFKNLVTAETGLTSDELAAKTSVHPALMKRFLRYYQAFDMVKQQERDSFFSNNVTQALAAPSGQGVIYLTELIQPSYLVLPEYLKKRAYGDITNPIDAPWNAAYQWEGHPFGYLEAHPESFKQFMIWIAQNRQGLPLWHDVFPFDQVCGQNTTADSVLFVDIGSSLGNQSIALRAKYPNLAGRIIIQDTEPVIASANPPKGIEPMVYDFFTSQPVKGARAYYMRNILHDHPDEQARKILNNTISAMTEDSILLIDDMMLPAKDAPWRATILDILMMTCLAGKERSEEEIFSLLGSVGLEIISVWKYTEECDDCIIVAKPKIFI